MHRRFQAWAVPTSLTTTGGILVSFFSFVVLVIPITRTMHKEPRGYRTSTVAPSHAQSKQEVVPDGLSNHHSQFHGWTKKTRPETLGQDSAVACAMCTGRSSTERLKARQMICQSSPCPDLMSFPVLSQIKPQAPLLVVPFCQVSALQPYSRKPKVPMEPTVASTDP